MILGIDIGNTTTEIGSFSKDGKLDSWKKVSTSDNSHERLVRELSGFKSTKNKVFAASVVPTRNSYWNEVSQEFFHSDVEFLNAKSPWSFRIDVELPERVGIDRLANLEAALSFGKSAIVIDAGTATKIDLVELANGESLFRGGLIIPGVGISQEALTEKTAQLPTVELTGEAPLIGRNTEAAIRSGAVNGFAGMVDRVVERIFEERRLPSYTPVVATGGFHALLRGRVPKITHFEPHLTLEGIYAVARKF
jgi:type III pantothenate kinase